MESGRRNFIMGYDPLGRGGTLMESGRRNFIMGYDPLGWGGIHGIRKRKLYHGHERGVPPILGGERGREGARGGDKGREGGERWATGREGARGSEEMLTCYDPLGWGGTRKKTFYHGIQSFTVGGEHSWNQEEEILSWDTRGVALGSPNIGRREGREGVTRGEKGREGMEMAERGARGSEEILTCYDPLGWGGGHSWN